MDIEKLGCYFTHHDILKRYCITFESFCEMVRGGLWEEFITERQPMLRLPTVITMREDLDACCTTW